MKITAEPRSDQWNADDFIGGPRTFTIAGVRSGTAEQKYDIDLVEGEGRCWRPPLTILRLLMAAWGDEGEVWAGRRATLYHDSTVKFGGQSVGGIRVSHLSHITKPLKVAITESRGKKALLTVQPLPDAPAPQQPSAPTPLQAAKAALWAAWTPGHGEDAAALAEAFQGHTGAELSAATVEQLESFTAHLSTDATTKATDDTADDGGEPWPTEGATA